ncbi:MAG: hypothetical protein WC799_13870 [Desulfobacteraceae bacterium]|jgi:hypothetical protein
MEKTSRVHGAFKLGLLVRDVDGFGDGHYVADINKNSIGCIDAGDKTGVMGSACLDQRCLANASVHFVVTGDLERVERELGTGTRQRKPLILKEKKIIKSLTAPDGVSIILNYHFMMSSMLIAACSLLFVTGVIK